MTHPNRDAGGRTGPDVASARITDPIADAPELCRLSASQLTTLYRQRKVSPLDVARAVLDRAETIHAKFNVFMLIDRDGALANAKDSEARWANGQALSPIDGVPVTVKDLLSVKGWPLRLGSSTTSADPVPEDAPSVKALRLAGAVLIGLTTTPEFGWKGVADSPLWGVTLNPWNPALTPGGSSGGAAVAAVSGCGVMHLGSDGGGSIRIPASFTGVFGHKPSFGRVPYFPPSAFGTVGHLGPISRTVEDAALMLHVMSVRDLRDWHQNPLPLPPVAPPLPEPSWKGMRVGLWTEPASGSVDPEVLKRTDFAAKVIEGLGAVVEPIRLPGENLLSAFNILWFSGAASRVGKIALALRNKVDPGLLETAEAGGRYSAVDYVNASTQRAVFGIAMDGLLERYDLVISPATAILPFAINHNVPPDSGQKSWTEWASFSFPVNLSQQPACSVPMGFSKGGLPLGLQFIAAKGQDHKVLGAAASFAATRAQLPGS